MNGEVNTSQLIYKKIPAVMQDIEAIGKDRTNSQGAGFSYRGIDDIYNSLHATLAKHKIFTVPQVVEMKREERTSKSGSNLTYAILTIDFKFYAEDGSFVTATMVGEAMDSGDKASNKAQSVAHKYALLQVFAIPTKESKDPDSESHDVEPQQIKEPAPKPVIKIAPKTGINEAQIKRMWTIRSKSRWSEDDLRSFVKAKLNIDSTKDMTQREYNEICDYMEAHPKG